MKIALLSDLHFESSLYTPAMEGTLPEADVLVLAGDVCPVGLLNHPKVDETFEIFNDKYRWVFYVPGNHEYYGYSIAAGQQKLKDLTHKYRRIVLMNRNKVTHIDGEVSFIGDTLWTDFRNRDPVIEIASQFGIRDFSRIEEMTTQYMADENKATKKAIEDFLATRRLMEGLQSKVIVVTHFSPSIRGSHMRWGNDPLNHYFHGNCEGIMDGVDYWMHGHTHDSCDYMIENTRVLCNPKGYGNENSLFNPNFVFEV